jgi:methylated-DNA-protein-cysteine methyltransferase-like protein
MKSGIDNKQDIYDAIFDIVRLIPKGRVSSYGAIAEAVGLRSGARLVGYAMNFCGELKPKVPAHRVVNSAGVLTGKFHFNPTGKMQELLEREGVAVKNDKVVRFKKVFWHPKDEIH